MLPTALRLRLRNVPVLTMLRLEEALFRADARSWFITNEWDQGVARPDARAIVLGISGKPDQMVHADRAKAEGLPLIKRFSGGGTVVVDEDTLYATFIIGAGALPDVAAYPDPMLEWTSDIYDDALNACGAPNFALRAHDYCMRTDGADLKFGGNAQSISGKRWLHHTSILWDYAGERMSALRMPPRQPAYREARAHEHFVRGLGKSLPSRDGFVDALVAAVGSRLDLRPAVMDDARAALESPHRRVTTVIEP